MGVYWIGYPDEQAKAKSYLKEFSGQNYSDPDQYLKWWRREFDKVSY